MRRMIKQAAILSFLLSGITISACTAQQTHHSPNKPSTTSNTTVNPVDSLMELYADHSGNSQSLGTVGNGSLKNGALIPFSGPNFRYFDTTSYLAKRAFLNASVRQITLDTYKAIENACKGRIFGIMECSHEHGGKLHPHRTHQNGLSIDFMTPLLFNGEINHDLDTLGAAHYFMNFDDQGKYLPDPRYQIDFETMAFHLYNLYENALRNGYEIEKVIWKIELQDELRATTYGKKLFAKNVYFTQHLSTLINNLHDDHYHVDFKKIK
jgi:penicillin-insensitive murein endopeptidase